VATRLLIAVPANPSVPGSPAGTFHITADFTNTGTQAVVNRRELDAERRWRDTVCHHKVETFLERFF